ncbi:MAG: hypothetical protein ACPLPS_04110 [bacterium]
MTETIATGIAGIALAGLGYLIRKVVKNKAMADLLTSTLENLLYQQAITAVENWAEKKVKAIGQKISGDEKMQKAIQEVTQAVAKLRSWGINLDIDLNEDTLRAKLQDVFDKIKEKLHNAD